MQKSDKGEVEELRQFIHSVLGEIEGVEKTSKMRKGELLVQIDELRHKTDDMSMKTRSLNQGIENLGEMVACLVENSQIQQSLEAQDEEDRNGGRSPELDLLDSTDLNATTPALPNI
jgi:thioredoxin-like negative regulator of GroEL